MSKKLFSQAEQSLLRANPNVEAVTERSVVFTSEFKEKAYHAMLHGERMKTVFEESGIAPGILGMTRIYGFRDKLRKYAEREKGFANLRKSRHRGAAKGKKAETVEGRIAFLENQVAFMAQEVEFLKKIRQADLEAQRSWESGRRRK